MQEITRISRDSAIVRTLKETTVGYQSPELIAQFERRRQIAEQEAEKTGEKITIRETRNIGRNDLCPCGSEKKFKKCCGRNLAVDDKRVKQ